MAVEYIPATPDNVKVGDKVIVKPHYTNSYIDTVTKVNKASFLVGAIRYDRRGTTGDNWTPTHAYLYNEQLGEEIKAKKRRRFLITALLKFDWDTLSLEKLEKITCVINNKEE